MRPGCQLGRARRSASVSWDVLGAALSVGTCSAQRPGCQLGRARRSARAVSWDVLGAAPRAACAA
jgi:hypothetical protein